MGYIRKRYDSSWIVTVELGRDPVTGKRLRRQRSVRGTKRDAERVLREMEVEAERGILPAPGQQVTVSQLLDLWLEHVRIHRALRTYEIYAGCAERIRAALGGVPLERLRPAHIQRFYDSLTRDRLSPGYVRHFHRTLHAALSYAQRMDMLGRNPAARVTLPERKRAEPHVLTPEQLDALLLAVEGTRWHALFWLAAHTGLRVGELCGLWWDDVEWQTPALHVRRALIRGKDGLVLGGVKRGEARRVYLRHEDIAVLDAHRSRQEVARRMAAPWRHPEHVFTTPAGEWIHPTVPTNALKKLCRRLGLPPVSMHDLRHIHGSHLLAQGWDIAAVSERLGHSSVAFTAQVYLHSLPGAQQRYLDDKSR